MNKKINLSLAIGLILSFSAVSFVSGAAASESELLGAGYDLLRQDSQRSDVPEDLDYASVERVYDTLRREYFGELSEDELMDGLKSGLVAATGDPYTVYLNEDQAEAFESSLNGEFSGIGAEIAIKKNQLQVVAPLDGTPADRAGLRPGDPILKIDDEDTQGLTLEEAVTKIRGEKGSTVTLTVFRSKDAVEIDIVRDDIVVPTVESRVVNGNIGIIELSTFGNRASAETLEAARDLADQNVSGIVLDLRNNSGGLLDASVDIAGIWLDNDVVVEQRSDDGDFELRSGSRGSLFGVPTVVLINGGSASASEIVAGALQDHGVATVIGEQSFGKGSVQSLEDLPGGSQLKVTIARWFTPNGTNIDKEGITPDEEVELTDEDFDNTRDPQMDAALKSFR